MARLSVSRESESRPATTPIGTLNQKIQCQLSPLMTAPPTTGPIATATPETAPHMPMAAPRFSTGKASLISVSETGMITAAPSPSLFQEALQPAAIAIRLSCRRIEKTSGVGKPNIGL
jgi:hypothetical protein